MFFRKKKRIDLERRLSKDEINELDLRAWEGPVEVVRGHGHMIEAVRKLTREKLIGFDTETRPAFRKGESYPTSLVQLAAKDCVYIFQLQFINDPSELFSILADRQIIKAGVSIHDDVKDLRELSDFEPASFVDLGDSARKKGLQHHGLRGLAALLLNFRITKSGQRYNWSVPRLSRKAVTYAATDAWLGRELYLEMKKHKCL